MAIDGQWKTGFERLRQKYTRWRKLESGHGPKSGEFFESYIAYMYSCLLSEFGEAVKVKKDVIVMDGVGSRYQIDIVCEYEVARIKQRIAVECKDTERPTERDEVIAFAGKLSFMANTTGMFVSRSGFQQGALEYLDKHGIDHMDGSQMLSFPQMVGARLSGIMLPSERAKGEPFWAVMSCTDGELDGSYLVLPESICHGGTPDGSGMMLLPLFFSRRQAEQLRQAWEESNGGSWVVRGVTQPTLRVLTQLRSFSEGQLFALAEAIEVDGQVRFRLEEVTPQALSEEYLFYSRACPGPPLVTHSA